ncbi:AMIN-like domain-containing (lipo)protein [Lentzea sp. E54]|uniref:AMIN-like domain-containing (lipo)protein n=1 Tax=Lentzea xerophila TaxID=3435883 RepID=UPI003DA5BFAF
MNRRFAAVLLTVLAVFTVVPIASAQSTPTLSNIRTGQHNGFSRVVLDLSGLPTEHRVSEVTSVSHCATGNPITVAGGQVNEILSVTLIGAAAHDDNGNLTYTGSQNFATPGLRDIRGVALTCDFEATLGVAVGYSNTASWHRVFTLTSPNRLVIDVGL